MDELIRLLNEGNYSCVVRQGEEIRTFSRRGVADPVRLVRHRPRLPERSLAGR